MGMINFAEQTPITDGPRICQASETLARVLPFMSTFGITRLANVTGLDRIDLPVVVAIRPNARSIAISQGKGVTLAHAKASAVMEAIEIWHAEHLHLSSFYASIADLEHRFDFVDLAQVPQTPRGRMPRTVRAHWVIAHDLLSNREKLVPLEMVHADYTHPVASDAGYFPASTNGLASGNHALEALCHAICEVIERDALAVWHHLSLAQQQATRLDLDSIADRGLRASLRKFTSAGLEVAVWDVTTDIDVPSFLSVVHDTDTAEGHLGMGSGTHPNSSIALHRALNEAAQTRLNYISGAREDLFHDEFSSFGRAAKMTVFEDVVNADAAPRRFKQIESYQLTTLQAEVNWLKERLEAAGVKEIATVDLTRQEYGIPVVRVIIPGLEAPHDDAAYVPGPRALEAALHMAVR